MNQFIVTNIENYEEKVYKLSENIVEDFLKSRKVLSNTLKVETLYDQVIEAHWDFKNKLNYWNMRTATSMLLDYNVNHEIRSSLNRLAFNLLNLGKLYLDWHYFEEPNKNKKKSKNNNPPKTLAYDITKDEAVIQKVREQRKSIFENNNLYRIACKLRGYSQHSALPINKFRTNNINNAEGFFICFEIFYEYDELINFGVPKEILNESDTIDLKEIIDGYVYAIGQKHTLNRKLISDAVELARNNINALTNNYFNFSGFNKCYGQIISKGIVKHNVDTEWFDVVNYLQKKNCFNINHSNVTFDSFSAKKS
ncbi:hypothetical protein H4J63_09765 [Pseudoalteromonas sp. 5Ae-yellow]|uniref:hypothetical protein n=1 Tax=Pseudoalteromonas sp. 5Ae-yellow TaxID=2759847 RepID=UPI0015F5D7C3|nr:hypothetical protein [Pseudoalteromonas sp. 5Ae-yellow]MBA6409607.1 hypothetical protein [Pseudoalteromonas sp. 5Ae-yellow]